MPFAPGGGKAIPFGRGGKVMPFGRGPGGGKGRPLGRVGIWGTEPGRPVGAVGGGVSLCCVRSGGLMGEKDARGIIPAGREPGMPNDGGGMPPVKGLVSICVVGNLFVVYMLTCREIEWGRWEGLYARVLAEHGVRGRLAFGGIGGGDGVNNRLGFLVADFWGFVSLESRVGRLMKTRLGKGWAYAGSTRRRFGGGFGRCYELCGRSWSRG
jgi:hypothetical protein